MKKGPLVHASVTWEPRWHDDTRDLPTHLIIALAPWDEESDEPLATRVLRTIEADYDSKVDAFTHRPVQDGDSYLYPDNHTGWRTFHLIHKGFHATGMFAQYEHKAWAAVTRLDDGGTVELHITLNAKSWEDLQHRMKAYLNLHHSLEREEA